jgi:hypothetical protein
LQFFVDTQYGIAPSSKSRHLCHSTDLLAAKNGIAGGIGQQPSFLWTHRPPSRNHHNFAHNLLI